MKIVKFPFEGFIAASLAILAGLHIKEVFPLPVSKDCACGPSDSNS